MSRLVTFDLKIVISDAKNIPIIKYYFPITFRSMYNYFDPESLHKLSVLNAMNIVSHSIMSMKLNNIETYDRDIDPIDNLYGGIDNRGFSLEKNIVSRIYLSHLIKLLHALEVQNPNNIIRII
jgi:hypothetical protein